MKVEINLFKVDDAGRITHRAGVMRTPKNPNPVITPGTVLEWCPLSPDELAGNNGIVHEVRWDLYLFDAATKAWTIPDVGETEPNLDFDNLRQIFNPYGCGTNTCTMGGIAIWFIEALVAFPRFVTPGGEIELGGADYLTANETPGKFKTPKPFVPPKTDDPSADMHAVFKDIERREFEFSNKVLPFKTYVDWIGKHAKCGKAAQGVVLAVDRLVELMRNFGIDGLAQIDRACGAAQDALAELCRALGDAETAAGDPPRAVAGLSQQQFDDLKGIANETQAGVNLAVKQIKGIAGAAKDMRETADDLKRTQEDAAETITDVAGELSKKMDAGMGAIGKVAGAVGKMGANVEAGRVAAERAAERADEARVRAGRAERNTRAIADVLASGWDGFLAALRKAGFKPKKQLPERAKSGIVKLWDQFKAEQYDAIIADRFDIDKREINHHSYDAFIEYCADMVVYTATPDGTNTTEYRLGEIIEQTDDVKKIVHTRDVQKSRAKKEREKAMAPSRPARKSKGKARKTKSKPRQ